MKQEIAYAN